MRVLRREQLVMQLLVGTPRHHENAVTLGVDPTLAIGFRAEGKDVNGLMRVAFVTLDRVAGGRARRASWLTTNRRQVNRAGSENAQISSIATNRYKRPLEAKKSPH